ncbi:MAG: glutamate cyclase domain-containing protein [Alphaproteobacteria bacterium]
MAPEIVDGINRLEDIIGHDPGNRRGIMPLVEAARGGLLAAAHSLHQHPTPDICIMTGFYLAHGEPPACETDGPPGAAHLAAGFERTGIPCRIVTDAPNLPAVRAAANAVLQPDFPIDVAAVPGFDGGHDMAELAARWHAQPPSHVIAIERCGTSSDGIARNSKGAEMTAYNAPLEELFLAGDSTRIAIGDGGNEIGMGSLPAGLVARHIPNGELIASTVPCDHLIVSGVSNWGAAALLCAFALARPDSATTLTASLTPEIDRQILEQMVTLGPAVAIEEWGSGAAPFPTLAVDGLPSEYHAGMMGRITDIVR